MSVGIARTRPITHPGRKGAVAMCADRAGVSAERLLEVVVARKRAKAAKTKRKYYATKWQQRFATKEEWRAHVKEFGYQAARRPIKDRVLAGEGEFRALLLEAGMDEQEFAVRAGYSGSVVSGWNGHPMYHLPAQFLRYYIWATNMAKAMGDAAEKYKAKGDWPRLKGGPRAAKDIGVVEAAFIDCPKHGRQKAWGQECPLC